MYGFSGVWAHTSIEVQKELVSVLDSGARYELVRNAEQIHPAVEAASLAHGDSYESEALARREELSPRALLKLSKDRRKGVAHTIAARADLALEHLSNLHGCDDPELNLGLFSHPKASPELRRLIAGGFSGKRNKGGVRGVVALSYPLIQELEKPENRELALESLDPNVLEHLIAARAQLSKDQQVQLLRRSREHKGWRKLLLGAVGGWDGALEGFVRGIAQGENTEEAAFLSALERAAIGESGPAGARIQVAPALLLELARSAHGEHTQLLTAESVPWESFAAQIGPVAFVPAAMEALLARPDVPESFYQRCFEVSPDLLSHAPHLPVAWVLAAIEEYLLVRASSANFGSLSMDERRLIGRRRAGLQSILGRHVGDGSGVTIEQIVPVVRPASELPGICSQLGSRARGTRIDWGVEIHRHIQARLGERGAAWRTLHELLPSFGGSLDELLAVVEATQR